MPTSFLDDKSDLEWLFSTHLKAYAAELGAFTCAVLHGNEDAPERVECFEDNHYQAIPVVFVQDETGELRKA